MLRCAILGLGYWGRKYLRVLRERPDTCLVAACDPSAEAVDIARALPEGMNSWRATSDPCDVFSADDVEAVVVATPATTHYELIQGALDAGKHVLSEKPLAMSTGDCRELVSKAGRMARTLFVGHTFIYHPAVRVAKQLVTRGDLGSVLHLHAVWSAPGPIRHDVNALWDLAPHPISIMTYLVGRPTAVSATGQRILPGVLEDIASLHLRFGDRATADIHVSWLGPRKTRMVTITGARRVAIFDDMTSAEKLRVYETAADDLLLSTPGRLAELFEAPVQVPAVPWVEPLAAQVEHFVECCRHGVIPQSDGLAAHHVVGVIEAAQESLAESGAPVALAATTT